MLFALRNISRKCGYYRKVAGTLRLRFAIDREACSTSKNIFLYGIWTVGPVKVYKLQWSCIPPSVYSMRIFSSCTVFSKLEEDEKLYRYVLETSDTVEFYGESERKFSNDPECLEP